MKAIITCIAILIATFLPVRAAQDQTEPTATADLLAQLPDDLNLHYTGKYCLACHTQKPVAGGAQYLRYNGDVNQLCRCHAPLMKNYPHPVNVKPSDDMRDRVPAAFPLRDGQLVCNTCHQIYLQCQYQPTATTMLRGAPYSRRTDVCFACHDRSRYKELNPHQHVDDQGKLLTNRCLYCHKNVPDVKQARYQDVTFVGDLVAMCQRCHNIRGNHAGNADHLVKPSTKLLTVMQQMEIEFGIILPLDADGRMTCITCHNAHAKGVIPVDRPAAKGAGAKYRHRLPGRLCTECHRL